MRGLESSCSCRRTQSLLLGPGGENPHWVQFRAHMSTLVSSGHLCTMLVGSGHVCDAGGFWAGICHAGSGPAHPRLVLTVPPQSCPVLLASEWVFVPRSELLLGPSEPAPVWPGYATWPFASVPARPPPTSAKVLCLAPEGLVLLSE